MSEKEAEKEKQKEKEKESALLQKEKDKEEEEEPWQVQQDDWGTDWVQEQGTWGNLNPFRPPGFAPMMPARAKWRSAATPP